MSREGTTNRRRDIAVPHYDASGNMVATGMGAQYLYDGEGRTCAEYTPDIFERPRGGGAV